MKKVCMVVYSYYPWDPRVRKEAETLAENNYKVDVICLKNKNEKYYEKVSKVNIYRINIRDIRVRK
ncbi:MAG: hypothetical protein J7K26_01670 [Candidatus Aenigmarchaeota archaeon]|nr:hypothetical protein [Candidatus Aenigmarchaeota archaeon]